MSGSADAGENGGPVRHDGPEDDETPTETLRLDLPATFGDDSDELGPAPAEAQGEDELAGELPEDEDDGEGGHVRLGGFADDADAAAQPEPPARFGGPDDDSAEHPMLIADESDEARPLAASPAAEPAAAPSELRGAYECLELRTPLAELEAFARARVDALVRVGDAERAERTQGALRLGLRALREVMGGKEVGR